MPDPQDYSWLPPEYFAAPPRFRDVQEAAFRAGIRPGAVSGIPPKPDIPAASGREWTIVPDGIGGYVWDQVLSKEDGAGAGGNDRLQASIAALSGFLQAQTLADARRMAAAEEFQKMGAFALPKGSKTAPGYERGGAAQQLAAMQGRTIYRPPPIQTQPVNPAALEQPGQVPPEVMAMINAITGAGG